jgi:hypothetical protein
MKTLGPNIYRYRSGEIYKELHGRIQKTKILLIPLSNLWWIKNTEFREIKLMVNASLNLREEICHVTL